MDDRHWGAEAVDPDERSLPGLKAAFLLKHAPRHGAVLEVGSGDGKNLRTLALHLPHLALYGCDVRSPRTPPDGYVFTKVDGKLPASMFGRFDAVLLMDVLEHVPDPEEMLDDCARCLRPRGRLIAFVPVEGQPMSAYRLYRKMFGDDLYVETKEHVQAFTHEALHRLIARRFHVDELVYAYHALGHVMDATFFAAQRLPALRRFWQSENQYYNADKKNASGATGAFNRLLRAANAVAWAESKLLSAVPFTAAGQLIAATVNP
jgi:SAM-dependent methyltransferase